MAPYEQAFYLEGHFMDGPLKGDVRAISPYLGSREFIVPMTEYIRPAELYSHTMTSTIKTFEGVYVLDREWRDPSRRTAILEYRFAGIRHRCPSPPKPEPIKVTIEGDAEVTMKRKVR